MEGGPRSPCNGYPRADMESGGATIRPPTYPPNSESDPKVQDGSSTQDDPDIALLAGPDGTQEGSTDPAGELCAGSPRPPIGNPEPTNDGIVATGMSREVRKTTLDRVTFLKEKSKRRVSVRRP